MSEDDELSDWVASLGPPETVRVVDVARVNRRRTVEARRLKKLALGPTFGDIRGRWLLRLLRSQYDPDACQREGKR